MIAAQPTLLALLLLACLLSVATTFRRDNVEYRPPLLPTSQIEALPTSSSQQTAAAGLPTLQRYSIAQRLGAKPRFGSTVLPLRQAVERVPSPTERAEEHYPIRDAVEQRPVLPISSPLVAQWWNHRMAYSPASPLAQAQSLSNPSQRVAPLADKAVYCFVESWSAYRRAPMSFSADHVDPYLCTHLVYAFARVDSRTHKLVPVDEEYDIVKGGYRSVVFLKRLNPRLKVLLSVAGPFQAMTSSVARRTFILSAVRLLHEYNFDGLDLHWQLPELEGTIPPDTVSPHQQSSSTPTQDTTPPAETLSRLLEEMSGVFDARAWVLTLSVSASRFRAEDAYPADIAALASHVTHVLLKSYDLHEGERGSGVGGGAAVHHAPLQAPPPTQDVLALYFNVDYAVRYWLKRGVPRHKLIMGIPLYARTYTLKDANQWQPGSPVLSGGAESRYTQQPGLLAYYEVCEKLVSGDDVSSKKDSTDDVMKGSSDDVMREPWRLFRDQGNAPFMVRGDQWVGYEDPLSIQTKMRYVNQQKLGGVMVWALDLDDFQGAYCGRKYPLLNAVNDHLHAYDWPLAVHQPPLAPAPPTSLLAPPTLALAPPTALQATPSNPLQWQKPAGGVVSSNLDQSQASVSAGSQSEAAFVSPYVLSTPHDGTCRYGQHGYEQPNLRQDRSYGQRENERSGYEQYEYEQQLKVNDSYGQHGKEQSREHEVYRQHEYEQPRMVDSGCSSVYFRCDHLMIHRHLCPIGSRYEPAWGKCMDCRSQQLQNNNTISQKAELRKKKPSHNSVGDQEQPGAGVGGVGPRVVCYFTNWAWYRKGEGKFLPEHIEPSLCTHLIYAFASLDPNDLTLKPFDSWSDIDNNMFGRVVARAAASGASVLLSMGGWTDSAGSKYSQLVGDRTARRRFVADVLLTLRRHSFDGLQLDWNYPVCWQSNCKKGPASDKANFAKFVQELRQAFDKEKPRLQLSVAISGYREIIDRAYDMRALSAATDFIAAMTFDYHGAWEHETGHVAPLHPTPGEMYPDYNVDSTVKHLVELGADRSKLVVGMPFYGQSFTLATPDKGGGGTVVGLGEETSDPGDSGEFTKQPGMLAYYEICYRVSKQNWKSEMSEGGPYAYSGDQWVSYDDPRSIKQKAKYILTEKLGGAMAWTIDLDDFHNRCCSGETFPLLRALNRGLGRLATGEPTSHDCSKPTVPPTPPPVLTTLTPDNGLVSPEATTEMSSSSTTTTTTTQSWWTEKPQTTSTTTTRKPPTTSSTTTTQSWWTEKPQTTSTTTTRTPPTTSSTTTTTEEEPQTTDEEEPEEEETTTTSTTTTTTTRRPKPTRPKPTKPKPKPTHKPTSTSKPSTSKPTRPSTKPTSKPKPPPPPTLPPTEEVGGAATELPSSCNSGEYRADPTDCNAYFRCILGEFRRQRCAGSLHWNDRLQVCDWPQQAKCHVKPGHIESVTSATSSTTDRPDEWWTQSSSTWWSPEQTTPPHHTTTTTTTTSPPWWTPPPPHTTTWWPTSSSSTTTKKPRPGRPPKPQRPTSKPTTARPTTTTTTTTESRPPPTLPPPPSPPEQCQDGQLYPVREACDQYEVCVNGQLLRLRCAPSLLFNHLIGTCDWAHNVQCSTPARMEQELSRKSSGCSKGQFTAHPSNCNQYLQCQWGAYEIYSCPPGLHWNSKNNICDWPSRSTCRGGSSSPSNSGGGGGGGGSSKPVGLATTSTTRNPQWEWKPESTTEWSWTSPATSPKPIRNKPSKPTGKHPLSAGGFKVVCYFTNWAWYRTGPAKYVPEDIDTSLCTHVLYGFAVLDFENLIIKAHDSWADFDNKFYERVVAMKKKGVHVLLAIGGWNDSQGDKYSRLVNSAAARQRFIKHVIPFLLKYDFDGLDLDWEYPKCWQVNCDKGPASDKESFGLFVKELKTAFRAHNLLLSAAVSPSKAVIDEGYDVKTMAEYLDWISVMTYDYHGQWDKKTGHLAPMYYHPEDDFDYFNANYSINYWLSEGVPKRKLVMGMPLYGQSFTLAKREQHGLNAAAPGPGQAGESTRAAGFLAYYEICSRIKNGGWTVVQDEEKRMGPYAYKGDQWISFDDKDTIRRKSQWIREMGLGGGMIWALDLDDFRNTCGGGKHPLLSIIAKTLAKPSSTAGASTTTTTLEPEPEPTTLETSATTTSPIHSPTTPVVAEPEKPTEATTTTTTTEDIEEVEGTTEDELEEETTTTSTTTTTTTKRPRPAKPPGKPSKPKPKPKPKPTTTTTTTEKPPRPEGEEDHFKVVCYFTNWAWYRQGEGKYLPSDIDPELCTHIIYGFAVLDSDHLTIKPHDTWADFDNKFYEKVIAVKKKRGNIKVLIAIGGWNDSAGDKYSRLVNSAAARQRFVQHVLEFIQEHGFDGLDLDWEYPKCWQVNCQQGPDSDKESFAAFVKELHEAFKPHGLLLSAAVSPSRTVITAGYDVKALSQYLDWISVMAYDYHGQWDKVTGHVAPMYAHPEDDDVTFNTNFTMHYWMRQGADRRKLVVGMPMYGQSFSLATTDDNGLNAPTYGGGEAGEQTRARGFLAYYEICQRTLKQGWEVVRDEGGRIGPYARLRDQWVSFDDQAMIAYKSNFVKENNFGGAMVWALDLDDFRNLCGCEEYPLLKTINRVLRHYPGPQPACRLSPAHDGDNAESAITEFPERNNEVEGEMEEQQGQPSEGGGGGEQEPKCVNGVMAHPGDCGKYYSCWNRGLSRTQLSCPAGLHFDTVRSMCEWPDKAVCWSNMLAVTASRLQDDQQTSFAFQGHGPAAYFAGKFPWTSLQQGIPVWF